MERAVRVTLLAFIERVLQGLSGFIFMFLRCLRAASLVKYEQESVILLEYCSLFVTWLDSCSFQLLGHM